MSDSFRFVHAADIHLDSPLAGAGAATPPAIRDALLAATFGAFGNLIRLCIDTKADALLIAGDVYDARDKSLRAQLEFVAGLRELDREGIRSFICHGNHDPLDGWEAGLSLPPSAHRFGSEFAAVPLDPCHPERAVVYGVSYPSQRVVDNVVRGFRRSDDAGFAIGLMHANVGSITGHENYAPCSLDDLASTGIDYWALGHVHTRAVLSPSAPAAVYPGNLQGRHVNETGERGAYVVTATESGAISLDFRPLDVVRWRRIEADVSRALTWEGALEAASAEIERALDESANRPVMYRLELRGRTPAYHDLLRPGSLEELQSRLNEEWGSQRPFAWCERITHRIRPEFDRERARSAGDFLAEVLSSVDAARADPSVLAELRGALEPLFGSRTRRILKDLTPNDDELLQLLAEAEMECVERLQGAGR